MQEVLISPAKVIMTVLPGFRAYPEARGGYTYRWYTFDGIIPGPVNTNRIDNLIAGTYYLEIKDVLNCIQIETVVITEPDGMQLFSYQLSKSPDNNFNISCNGDNDGSISMTVSEDQVIIYIPGPAPMVLRHRQKILST